jgi:hypothetical protein
LLAADEGDLPAAWRLPRTATPAERLLAGDAARGLDCRPARGALVAIHTPAAGDYQALAEACKAIGCATVWLAPGRAQQIDGAAAVIWDGCCENADETDALCELARRLSPAPLAALLSFPRSDDRERLLAAGASAVLAKPLPIEDLYRALFLPAISGCDRPGSTGAALRQV